jgi:glycerol uptake facilitator-like aquaporin
MSTPAYSRPRKLLAEFSGTLLVVLVAAGAAAMNPGPLAVAVAYGVAYGFAVAALGPISGGHFNPAVTIAHWVTHRFDPFDTLLYAAAQLAGASAAVYVEGVVLRVAVLAGAPSTALLGPPELATGVTRAPALLIEATMTFALVLALWAAVVGRARPRYWLGGIVAGAVVAAASFAGAPYTGGVMNPALAFGPALVARQWAYQAVYWVGPLAGGVAASSLYDLLFRLRPDSRRAALKGGATQSGSAS